MPTWVRSFTADKVGSANASLTGNADLDTDTIPGDFDAAGVTSVQFEFTLSHLGTFGSGTDADSYALQSTEIQDSTDSTQLATVASSGTITEGTATVVIDLTDNSPNTGASAADWQGARFAGQGSGNIAVFSQAMGPDGTTPQILASSVTITITYTPAFVGSIEQKQFRFRHDDGSETAAAWRGNEDLNIDLEDADIRFRLRIMFENDGDTVDGTTDWKLQSQLNADSWQDVTTASAYLDPTSSTEVTDGGATTQQVGAGTFDAGEIEEANGIVENSGLTTLRETEHEWVLVLQSSGLVATDTIKFRVQYDPNGLGYRTADTLTVTPQITILAKSVEQSAFRWRNNDGTETGATWRQVVNVDDTHDGDQANGIRLRFAINSNGGGPAETTYNMYVSKNGGAYTDLFSSTDWEVDVTSPDYADDDPTTQQISSPDGFRVGQMVESIQWTELIILNDSGYEETTEFEFLINPKVTLTDTDFYDFQLRNNTVVLETYTETPRLTISAGGAGSASPAVIARSFTVDAVTTVGPAVDVQSVIARTFTVDAATTVGSAVDVQDVIARSFTVDAPALVGQAVQTAPLIARSFAVDQVTPSNSDGTTVTVAAIVRSFTVDDPTPVGAAVDIQALIARSFGMGATTTVGPAVDVQDVIARAFALDQVTTSNTDLGAGSASPAAIVLAFTVDGVTLAGGGVDVQDLIARSFGMGATTQVGPAVDVQDVIARSFALDAVTLVGPGVDVQDLIARSFGVNAVTTVGPAVDVQDLIARVFVLDPVSTSNTDGAPGTATPEAIVRAFALGAPTLVGGGVDVQSLIARSFGLGAVTVAGAGVDVQDLIARSFTVDAVTLAGGGVQTAPLIALVFVLDPVTLSNSDPILGARITVVAVVGRSRASAISRRRIKVTDRNRVT